ncbi:hypothetical protein AB0I66_00380 [Streptomyces sp. NPDC050439]|uniref:hypothetical protein n=1 Tax=unclassified Streptomyces TaxID=2593676 RepID=UPI00342736AA
MECDAWVGFRVHSAAQVVSRRRWWITLAVVAAVVLALCTPVFLDSRPDQSAACVLGSVLGAVLALGFLVVGVLGAVLESGVTSDPRRRNGPHQVTMLRGGSDGKEARRLANIATPTEATLDG